MTVNEEDILAYLDSGFRNEAEVLALLPKRARLVRCVQGASLRALVEEQQAAIVAANRARLERRVG